MCVIDRTGGPPAFKCLDVCVIDHTGGSPPFECLDVCVIDHTGGSTAFKCVVNFTGGKRLLFALHKKRLSYIAENTSFSFCYCHCRELWDGPRAGPGGAVEFLGVDEVGKREGKGGGEIK